MQKLFILAGILTSFGHNPTLHASNRKKTISKKDFHSFSIITSVHQALHKVFTGSNPDALREIYLSCINPAYVLSSAAIETLTEQGLLNKHYKLKSELIESIQMLLLPLIDNPDEVPDNFYKNFHVQQCIEDLIKRYPTIILPLVQETANDIYAIDDNTLAFLYDQYRLTKSPTEITPDELSLLIAEINKEKNRQRLNTQTPIDHARENAAAAPPVRFKLCPIK